MRSRDPVVLRKITAAREQSRLAADAGRGCVLAIVRRLRPGTAWDEVPWR